MEATMLVETPVRAASHDREATAKMLMKLFDLWELSTEEQLEALGLASGNRAALSRYRRGDPIPASRDTQDRAGYLLAIHKNLRLLFPQNRDLCYAWIKARNRAFDYMSPIEVICRNGFAGLLMVRAYLDKARGQ